MSGSSDIGNMFNSEITAANFSQMNQNINSQKQENLNSDLGTPYGGTEITKIKKQSKLLSLKNQIASSKAYEMV